MSVADGENLAPLDIEDIEIRQFPFMTPSPNAATSETLSNQSQSNPEAGANSDIAVNVDNNNANEAARVSDMPPELRRSLSLLPPDIVVADMAPRLPDPLIVRGCGTLVVFGLSNRFPADFPPNLIGKIASEEYCATVKRINLLLTKSQSSRARWLIFACLCCFCTLSASLWPVACLAKRTRAQLEKLLDWENNRLYYKLGFRWRLVTLRSDSTMLREYALALEHLPRVYLHLPE